MKRAMKSSLSTIVACAATVAFGFAALCFMQFKIGSDMGLSLLKGTALSLLSVVVFLPALTIVASPLLRKTKHRRFLPPFARAGKYILKARIPVIIIVVLVVVPCFLAVSHNDFLYGTSNAPAGTRADGDEQMINAEFGTQNPVVVMVPRGDVAREKELGDALKDIPHVTNVMSYAETVGATVPPQYLDSTTVNQFYSDNYARMVLYTNAPSEGDETWSMVEQIRNTVNSYYDTSYTTGTSMNLYDMKNVTETDHNFVDLLSIVAIALVIAVIFRSLALPILLVGSIEVSININMATPYFSGTTMMFIGYLIISTVQLASAADYAILYTQHYLRRRREMPARQAAEEAHATAFQPIITSAAILSLAGFALYIMSSLDMVKEMGLLLGRGTLISLVIVTCFLPAIMMVLDRPVQWLTYKARFYKAGRKAPRVGKAES
jgi:predicted RND superfamily exporter protein